MPDEVISAPAVQATPAGYKVPQAQAIRVKSVRALVDGGGAAVAFAPTLQLIAPSGQIVWESATDTTVAAGGSADVSWFPHVAAGAAAGKAGTCDGGYDGSASSFAVPDSTVVDLRNHVGTNYAVGPDFDVLGAAVRGLVGGDYMVFARAEWAAGFAGDRYMTVYQTNPSATDGLKKPVTFRQSASPNGDVMWCAAGFNVNPATEVPIEFLWDVFQASGGPQTIQNYTYQIYAFPILWPTF